MDATTAELVAVLRQQTKAQLRSLRTLVALLSELDNRLEGIAQGGTANGNYEETLDVASLK